MKSAFLLPLFLFVVPAYSDSKPPAFTDYPTKSVYAGKPARIDLNSNRQARLFRTALKEGVKNGPNFAGRYAVVIWGCGTACQMMGIVDVPAGKVMLIASYSFNSERMPTDIESFQHHKDSELLIVAGTPNDREQYGFHYYHWTGGKLKRIAFVPFPPLPKE